MFVKTRAMQLPAAMFKPPTYQNLYLCSLNSIHTHYTSKQKEI